MYPLSDRPFLNLSFLATTQPYSALSTTMLWLRTMKNKESSKAWTETMSQSHTCFRKLFLSSIFSRWQSLHLESGTAIFPTSWSCHSTLNRALIVSNYQDAGVVFYLLMSPGLCAVQVTHIKGTSLSEKLNAVFLLTFYVDCGGISAQNRFSFIYLQLYVRFQL